MIALVAGDVLAAFPTDAWMAVVDPGPGSPADPADNPAAVGIIADRADVAAMIAADSRPAPASSRLTVAVCRPGPPPKTVHLYLVNRIATAFEPDKPIGRSNAQ